MPFSQVEGQEYAVSALLRAVQTGRLHHAYLFDGPDGVGKSLCARALAQALLCQTPVSGDACGQCAACRKVQENSHADLHTIERKARADGQALEAMIKVEQVREIQKVLSFKGFEGGRRVVLLFEPERMNATAANALLKILEEPGEGTHFILVSSASHRVLPTILSRCQRVRFQPLERSVVARHLAQGAELSESEAWLLAGLADGSIGQGLLLAGSAILPRRQALLAQCDDPNGLKRLPELFALAEELSNKRDDLPLFFHLLRTWYRDLGMILSGVVPQIPLVHSELEAELRERAKTLSLAAVFDRIEQINLAETQMLDGNANARLALEALFLRLAGSARCPVEN